MNTSKRKARALRPAARVLLRALVLAPVLMGFGLGSVVRGATPGQAPQEPALEARPTGLISGDAAGIIAIGVAVASGLSCLGAAYAVGRVGAAALGAASERPELLTRSLIFVALGEGIAVFGFLAALLLWLKL
jgi:V/A-type H+-transporting ATPase subunit K